VVGIGILGDSPVVGDDGGLGGDVVVEIGILEGVGVGDTCYDL